MENKQQDIGFTRGVAYAIAMMERDGRLVAQDLLDESGITFKKFVTHGVAEYDLKEIAKLKFPKSENGEVKG